MPTNSNFKKRQVLKPASIREVTIDDITESADKLGLEDDTTCFRTISCPVTRGSWDEIVVIDDGLWGKKVKKKLTMIRIVGPAYL